jgi:hypothetical protein
MKQAIIFSALALLYFQSFSQPRSMRKLPHPINQPTFSAYAPFISLDGNSILFLNDYTDDGTLALQYSKRVGADWSAPTTLHKKFSWPLNFIRGYTLSPDGQTLFIASQASGGLGGFDIHAAVLKGTTFSDPINIGLPVNSKQHEAAPTLSADGQTMYFMRCESMTSQQADRCKLMTAKKQPGGRWGEAQELPANINTGNSQTPRIMADGETLIFSSNKMQPNAGGIDLYETKWDGQNWSNPVPLTFVNTPADDQFVSATSQGQYLLRETKGERRTELIEYLIPEALRPKAVMRIDGRLTDAAIPAYVSVYNLSTNKRIYNGRPLADGSFSVFLAAGNFYEVSIEPENGSNTFSSKFFDLTQANFRPFERYTTTLKQAAANDELTLEAVRFKPYTSELESTSQNELRRVSRLLKSTPDLKAEIRVLLVGYETDSIKSNADLTEVTLDSVEYYIDEIDSLGKFYQRDTVVAEYTYHNDRTVAQGQAVIEQLVSLGCDRNALVYFVNARPEAVITERKISVKAVLRKR